MYAQFTHTCAYTMYMYMVCIDKGDDSSDQENSSISLCRYVQQGYEYCRVSLCMYVCMYVCMYLCMYVSQKLAVWGLITWTHQCNLLLTRRQNGAYYMSGNCSGNEIRKHSINGMGEEFWKIVLQY